MIVQGYWLLRNRSDGLLMGGHTVLMALQDIGHSTRQ